MIRSLLLIISQHLLYRLTWSIFWATHMNWKWKFLYSWAVLCLNVQENHLFQSQTFWQHKFCSIKTYEKRKHVTSSWWHCFKMPFPNVPSIIGSARNITSSEKCPTCMFWAWLGMPNLLYILGLWIKQMEKLYDPMYGVGQKEDVNFSRLNTKLYSKISDLMSFLHYPTIETK